MKRCPGNIGSTLCTTAAMVLSFLLVTTAASGQKVTRQSALNSYMSKDFASAYSQFSELLAMYPADPLYKYYCGSSLVELQKEPSKAAMLLNDALNGSGVIRTVPADCYFYLGRALQMAGRYHEAVDAFSLFASAAGKKVSKDMKVQDYIKQCNDGRGGIEQEPAETKPAAARIAADSLAVKQVTEKGVTVLPAEFDKMLGDILDSKYREDSVAKLGKTAPMVTIPVKDTSDSRPAAQEGVLRMAYDSTKKDTVAVKSVPQSGEIPVFSEFSIETAAPPGKDDKVAIDPETPGGLIYRIQLAVFRNPVALSFFRGITPVQGFRNPSTGVTTYYAGRFRRNTDASQSLTQVRSHGFKDAFIVSLMDKKQVSADRAAVLEKEWGTKPLYSIRKQAADQPQDTVPQTLVFRVAVRRSVKPLPEDQAEAMRKMAGNKGFDLVNPEPRLFIYLVGRFLSYTTASEYADLLVLNGYKDARVTAWSGRKEIPVETARRLYDQHK
ncbi:MAG TPA: hypothetical protein VMT63_02435 [Bacteroidales bacterium]|nr:hypothetical protein [Bacteroidales bacterium]